MDNDIKKLRALVGCSWTIMILIWLFCFISGEKLNIVVHNERLIELGYFIDSYVILRAILSLILYYFSTIFVVYTFLKKKLLTYKPIIVSIYILILWSIKYIFQDYDFVSYIDFAYILLPLFIDYKNKKLYINCMFELIKMFIFSFICLFVKNYNGIKCEDLPSLIASIIMIDYYLFFIVNYLYSRKVVSKNETMGLILWKCKSLENYKRRVSNFISCCRSNYRSFISSLKNDGWRIYCALIFSIITYGSILIVSFFYNKMLEITISIICFHIFRKYDTKTFHATTSIKCFIVSLITFFVMNKVVLPFDKSAISAILLSYLLTKIMYYIQDYIDYLRERKMVKDLKPLEDLNFEELKDIYNEYSDNDIHAIYSCLHKDRSVNYENIAMRYNMSRMTLYRIMKKVRNKYNLLYK